MTVENTNNTISYTGNGSVTTFAYDFLIYSESHLKVYLDDVLQTVGYTVTDVGDDDGGDIIFNTPPGNDVEILIKRIVPYTQLVEYQPYSPFPAKTTERALD
ncbi:MAG: phage tail protein, partial [Alteromonadales bacterium]|nr:phage tail protein [Alteromonadales bacterium]